MRLLLFNRKLALCLALLPSMLVSQQSAAQQQTEKTQPGRKPEASGYMVSGYLVRADRELECNPEGARAWAKMALDTVSSARETDLAMIDTLGDLKSQSNIKIVEAAKRLDLLNEAAREARELIKQAKLETAQSRLQQTDPKGCYAGFKSVRSEIDERKSKADALVKQGDAVVDRNRKEAIRYYASAGHIDSEYSGLDQKTNDAKNPASGIGRGVGNRTPNVGSGGNRNLNDDPVVARAYGYLLSGDTKRANGDVEGAIADYTRAIGLKLDFVEGYYHRGIAKRAKGDTDGAIADYTRAIELKPDYALAYKDRGIAKQLKGDADGAVADSTKAVKLDEMAREAKSAYAARDYKRIRALADQGDAAGQFFLGVMYVNGLGGPKDDAEAVAWYRKAADQGYAAAQNNLGLMYETGRGVPKDEVEAIARYRKAADQGYATAQKNLGVMYANGRGVPKDEAEAVAWYRKSADQGDAAAQNNLGVMYANGRGVPKDETEAVAWYRKAADQGYATAQKNLGVMYANGRGVPKDEAEAVAWYHKAADRGDATAQNNLGVMYETGRGVPKDETEAVAWYRKSAEQGYATAQKNLGTMYANGRGVPKDEAEAVAWYRKSADQGYAAAQASLGLMYANGRGVPKDEAEAVAWYHKAADRGDATAQNNLGVMYETGRGVPKDETEAVAWYRKSAEQGYATAQKNLGTMYANGRGVPKDDTEAVAWYRKGADRGYAAAQNNLGLMYETGRGVPKNDAEAVAWYRKAADQGDQNAKEALRRLAVNYIGGGLGMSPNATGVKPATSPNTRSLEAMDESKNAGGSFLDGGVSQPAVIYKVDPEYPEEARKAAGLDKDSSPEVRITKYSGTVMLAVVVDVNGNARDIRVIKSLSNTGFNFDKKAIEAVQKWKFKPGEKGGLPVNVRATIEVNFRLQ